MSNTTAAAKQTFVIWAPDYTDPEAPSRRLAVREKHTEGVKHLVAEGFTSKSNPSIQLRPFVPHSLVYNDDTLRCGTEIAGPLSDPQSGTMNGSLIIVEAESVAAVRAVIERDIYWSSNVVSPFIFLSILVCSCVLLFFLFCVTFVVIVVVRGAHMMMSWCGGGVVG
jgi:uncharacterized protein